jgi:WD40 repeat protein
LAAGTNESQFGSGQIYVFGQERIQVTFQLPRRASVRELHFCADKLISLDSKNELVLWDLIGKKKITAYTAPGIVTAMATDPMLDWAFLGLQSGDVIAYDLDRERLGPTRLPNFWRERSPRARILSVVSLQIHPRDIGQLLIGYTEGAVIYSFKQAKPLKYFEYELPPGAPGGHLDPRAPADLRKPRLTQVAWHPSGTFIATTHEDGSVVFWDPKDGRVLMARTVQDTNIDRPGAVPASPVGTSATKEPVVKIAWCAKQNADDTGLLIAGGLPMDDERKGLTFLELGPTPVYATSSWQLLSDHFKGKRQHLLQTPPGAEIVDFCLIPRASPHFAGAQDPIAVIALLSSGELITLSFPSGHPISPTNQLHPSLTFVHPFIVSCAVTEVNRTRWLGMTEKRQQGPLILKGGAEATKAVRRYEDRSIIQTAHGDGTVRLWDAGSSDRLENSTVLQVDVARALGRYHNIEITSLSMAGVTGEFAVGTRNGEVVVYRWGVNKLAGQEPPPPTPLRPGEIAHIHDRAEPTLKEGLQPFALYNMARGPITALKMSDVGFVAVGSEAGDFAIIDMRGPALIYQGSANEFSKQEKKGFLRRSSTHGGAQGDWATSVAFGVMTLEGDDYSSIACFVGTNLGRLATFKILPQADGRYTAKLDGVTHLHDRVVSINPIVATSGQPAVADGPTVASLREGRTVPGALVVGKLKTDTNALFHD